MKAMAEQRALGITPTPCFEETDQDPEEKDPDFEAQELDDLQFE